MDSAADVSLCLHAWNWGWALWSKWKRTAEVCSAGESKLRSQSESEAVPTSGFSQVPLQSLPSVIRDMGIPRPVALIHLSPGTAAVWHLQWKHCEWVPAVADHQCLHASSHRVHFYINSALSSVSPHTGFPFQCKTVKQSTKQQLIHTEKSSASPWCCWLWKNKT